MTRSASRAFRLLGCASVLALCGCSAGSSHPTAAADAVGTTVANTTTFTHASSAPTAPAEPQRFEPPLPIAIQEAAAASAGDRLYVAGGYDETRNSSASVFAFDGSAWTRQPSLPVAVNHPGAAAVGNTVYVAGGFTTDGATNRMFRLSPGSTSWHELAPMRRRRGALALLSAGGRLYAIGGRDGAVQVAVPESYDADTNTWHDIPPMPAPRNHVAGYVDGSLACVAGGRTPATSASIDCFDSKTSAWRTLATLPTGTSGAAAGKLNGVTLVAGGEPARETGLAKVVQVLRSGSWTTEPMLVPRHGAAFAIYRRRLWACGGATAPGFQATAQCTSLAP